MDAELNALVRNDAYELWHLPVGRKAVSSRWVYDIKGDGWFNPLRGQPGRPFWYFNSEWTSGGQKNGFGTYQTFGRPIKTPNKI